MHHGEEEYNWQVTDFQPPARIKIYPNPASEIVTVSSEKSISKIEIYSVAGELMNQISNIAENQVRIPIGDYSSGIYFVRIFQDKNRIAKKVVVH